jgi:hypothetical protein
MQLKKAEILVSETKSKIEHFQAVWEGYKTKASAEVAVEGAKTERYAARTNRGQLAVAQYSEAVKAWSIEVDGEIKSKNFELEKSRLEAALYEAKLKGSELEIQQAREKLEHWKGAWAAYQAQADTTLKVSADNIQRYGALTARGQLAIQRFGEEVRYWSSLVDAELKSKGFILQKAEIEAKNYATQYGAIDAMATATNALINGRVAMAKLNLEHDVSDFETEKTKNEIGVEVGKIAQAAQEAKARIDVAQAEWVGGQATSMLQRIAELSFGFSQAAVSASDVGLSSGTSVGISQSISASQNEDLAWEYTWPSGPAPTGAIS